MATTAPPAERYRTLDIVRGVAVIGILAVNIGDFALPSDARLDPTVWGGTDPANLAVWAVNWVVFDNKMRGLFSLLFGASLLVVADRARASGRNAWAVQLPRLLVLLALGAAHFVFLWDGDILMLYALVGALALSFIRAGELALVGGAAATFVLTGFVRFLVFVPTGFDAAERQPGPIASELLAASIRADRSSALSAYGLHVGERVAALIPGELANVVFAAPDTLGLMLVGMVLLRSDLLTGAWERRRAWRLAGWLGLAGGLPVAGIAAWLWANDFPNGTNEFVYFVLAYPFNIALTVAWATFLSGWAATATGWLARALEATGRAAFSNYIATSVVMTTIFYGYGGGLYGEVTRSQAWLFVAGAALLMLVWSRPWLTRYRYGPLEWLWRSVSRGRLQPMAGGALARP